MKNSHLVVVYHPKTDKFESHIFFNIASATKKMHSLGENTDSLKSTLINLDLDPTVTFRYNPNILPDIRSMRC